MNAGKPVLIGIFISAHLHIVHISPSGGYSSLLKQTWFWCPRHREGKLFLRPSWSFQPYCLQTHTDLPSLPLSIPSISICPSQAPPGLPLTSSLCPARPCRTEALSIAGWLPSFHPLASFPSSLSASLGRILWPQGLLAARLEEALPKSWNEVYRSKWKAALKKKKFISWAYAWLRE